MHTDLTVASVFAAETCADVVGTCSATAAGGCSRCPGLMQRLLRDVLAARQHIGLSEEAYERAAASASPSRT